MREWKENLRVVQYNLQIQDTGGMQPEKIAKELAEEGADAVVVNIGGIYAWYRSKVPFHHVNEYLPKKGNLMEELINCCHKRGILAIGRFDFSKTDDVVFLQHPEWFVQTGEGKPVCYGSGRMGNWSLLMSTCINGGYRNGEFAVPVLEEALQLLDLDGVFFNAPHMETCFCENCRRKYRKMYGKDLPMLPETWEKEWKSACLRDNMRLIYQTVKNSKRPVPIILYYGTYREDGKGAPENLDWRYETADRICTEAQDVLSAGKQKLPHTWKPTLNMKLGQSLPGKPRPFGIIHSCPGMDWRHTGLPAAEYEFWMSQIPASGGQLWHSLTGYEDTITDKRLLEAVRRVNRKAGIAAGLMEKAETEAQTLLWWNAGKSELGAVEGLMSAHIPFDMMDIWHLDAERMRRYSTVIVPDHFPFDLGKTKMLEEYVRAGGNVFLQKTDTEYLECLTQLCGIEEEASKGPALVAAYGEAEEQGKLLWKNMEDNAYLPVKGDVLYAKSAGAERLVSLVPPFAPADGVGAPPERASIPVKHTQIPLLIQHRIGKGTVWTCFFELTGLLLEIGLADQKQFFENCIRVLNGEAKLDASGIPDGVYVYPYISGEQKLIHLVNGLGARPVRNTVPCYGLELFVKLPGGKKVLSVESVLENGNVSWREEEGRIRILLDKLSVWDMIVIRQEERS